MGSSGVQSIMNLQNALASNKHADGTPLSESVSFALLNVFGRNLIPPAGPMGRGHNANQPPCSVFVEPGFRPSVVGGIEPYAGDWALAVDSSTGAPVTDNTRTPAPSPSGADRLQRHACSDGDDARAGAGVSPSILRSKITLPKEAPARPSRLPW